MQEMLTFLTNHPALSAGALVVILLLLMLEILRAKRSTFKITAQQATQLINHDNAVVVDLRSTEQFKKGHIIGAQSILSKSIWDNAKKLEKFKTKPLIMVCEQGVESQKIAVFLLKHGYNVFALAGGMRGWQAADMPIVKE